MPVNETTQLLTRPQDEQSSDGQSSDHGDDSIESSGRIRLAIFIAYLGAFLASSDESLVIATYDIIASEFHELSKGSWLVTGYNLGYCISLPVYGTLADTCGRKTSMLLGYLLFALGCLICSTSDSMTQLIAGRVISGAGSSGMVVMISILITDLAAPSDVALLRSYTNVVNMIGRGVGAPLGSLMVNSLGWRWAFAGRLPLILLCLLLSRVQFPMNRKESSTTVAETSNIEKVKRLDYFGIANFAAAVVTLLLALTAAGTVDAKTSTVYALLGVCAMATVVFAYHECLWATKPLVPLRLITQGIGQYWLVQVILFSGRNGVIATITQYMTQVKKMPEERATFFLVLCTMALAGGSIISGFSIKRTKRYKKMSIISGVVSIISSTLLFFSWHFDRPVWESLLVIPMSTPIGIIISGEFIGMTTRAPQEDLAACVGAYYLSQQLGIILGASIAPLLVRTGFMHDMAGRFGGETQEIVRHILSDSKYIDTLPAGMQEVVRSSLQYGYQFIPVFATVTAAVCLPSWILTREERVD
ncbi:MFS transporter [Aspergillus sclerotioniger CBS 115572]|uniref:MFS transporter n=1 Tax=Aspergillus sclerotioniger CBS 115572 TaxID=1450535 RepID=A0A317VSF4_9EURO|nr:MFS transporter [Aspergillus sclerotioniger CBS 115572]PWY77266.1 MFS transporter [Aspergillus sclerotioniger CBS 115572]